MKQRVQAEVLERKKQDRMFGEGDYVREVLDRHFVHLIRSRAQLAAKNQTKPGDA
jgi:hypothetical protein